MAREDHVWHVRKCADRRFAPYWVEHGFGLQTLCFVFAMMVSQVGERRGLLGAHAVYRRCRG